MVRTSRRQRRARRTTPRSIRVAEVNTYPTDGPDDLDGGAGVREPRTPAPTQPAGSIALDPPVSLGLDLAARR